MSAPRPEDDSIILEANDKDVLLGRGNAVNFRETNVRFRKLAQSKALRYATCSNKLEKDRIAESIIAEIKNTGGRFLRPISARNEKGEHLSAWEQVKHDVILTKAKQTLRDCAAVIRRETAARSSPPPPPAFERSFQEPSTLLPAVGLSLHQSLASSLHPGALSSLRSLPATGQVPGTDSSVLRPYLPSSLPAGHGILSDLPQGALSSQPLDEQRRRLLELLRYRQQSRYADSDTSTRGMMNSTSDSANPLATRPFFEEGRSQQDFSISNAALDLRRARELMLIEQYNRDRAFAEAEQRNLLNQLSSQVRAQHGTEHPQPPGTDFSSLSQLMEAQRLLNIRRLGEMIAISSDIQPPPETMARLATESAGFAEAKAPERSASFDSQQEKSQGSSTTHSTKSTNRPLKKRKGLPKQEEEG